MHFTNFLKFLLLEAALALASTDFLINNQTSTVILDILEYDFLVLECPGISKQHNYWYFMRTKITVNRIIVVNNSATEYGVYENLSLWISDVTLNDEGTYTFAFGSNAVVVYHVNLKGRNLLQRFIVLVVVVILSCGVAILPILIYFIIKKFTGSKNDFAGRQSFALPEIPAAVEESEYEEYSKIPEEIDQPYSPSCSNVPEYAECDMNNIPSCKYSTTLNDVTQVKLFYEKDMRKSKTIKAGPLYIRWTGTVAFTHDKVKRVMYTSVTDKALASNIVQWDKFLKRVVELPKSKHLLRIAGIGIDNGRQYLIHERLFRGSLAAYIKSASESTDSYKPLLPEHIIRLVLGILEGMEHIHSAGFLHPGLSTKKVLLNYKGVGKLYDFYLSEDAVNVLTIKRPGMNYSLNELSPEGIRRHQYSAASDVWSTAVLLWQMLSDGSLPFRHDNNANVDAETIPVLPKTWPKKFEYLRNCLLFDCWNTNESGRPTISELKRSIQKSTDVDTYNLPKMHGGSMAGYYMPMKKSMIESDT